MWIVETDNNKFKYVERYKDKSNKTKYASVTLNSKSKQAQNQAQKILFEKIQEKLDQPVASYKTITFEDLSKDWLKLRKKTVKASTLSTYQTQLNQINKHIGAIDINDLTAGRINRMFLDMFSQGLKYKTVQERYKLIKEVIKYGLEYDYLEEDLITSKLKLEKINVSEKRENKYLEVDEANDLFERMIEDNQEELADFLKLQMQTGMRFGEVAALHVPDIDLINQVIQIKYTYDRANQIFTKPKNNNERTIHFNDDTLVLIKKILRRRNILLMAYGVRDNNLLFFRQDGKPLDIAHATKTLHKYESEDKPLTTHIFRHTFITRMVESYVPATLIAEHVGHSDTTQIEQVYSHFSDKMNDDLKEAINRVSL